MFCGAVEIKRGGKKKKKVDAILQEVSQEAYGAHCGAVGLLFKTFKLRWL